jgi:hypothetical protein
MNHVLFPGRIVVPVVLAFAPLLTRTASAHPGHEEDADRVLVAQASNLTGDKTASGTPLQTRHAVSITIEGDYRVIRSNGWPDHAPGAFPRRGNPHTAAPQDYTFRAPLKPVVAATPEWRGGWWWGVALNGVPFEPGTGETWNNDPRSSWRYEAATGFLNLGLDEHNAHVQPSGAYHYHALPIGLVERLGGDEKKMLLVGWAADGFPLYTSRAYADAANPGSGLRKMKSSYQLRKGARPAQADGPGGNYDGRFTQDFEYLKGSGDLDELNGRTGVTPEFPRGTYYYCISAEFPFLPRLWRGNPDASFEKGDRPPGGAPPGMRPAGAGAPGPGFPPPGPILDALDHNRDGVIDAREIVGATRSLQRLDYNRDGKLTEEEYRPQRPPR